MKIGNVLINGMAGLAPMAGVTDIAFRYIAIECGASYTVSEMVSAKGLMYKDKKTDELLRLAPNEHPSAVQIFGADTDAIRIAVPIALEKSGADILDINMGCPMPKIVNNGEGSALMRDLPAAEKVIKTAVSVSSVPVTVKFRIGWDADSINCAEFAKMAEASGAAAICVHGRTREQFYSGKADWNEIAKAKAAVSIPVMANGDVFTAGDALEIVRATGADFVMVGRGAQGNPWIFTQINAAFAGQEIPSLPPFEERLMTAVRQTELAAEYKGEHIALLEARKQLAWYMKGEPNTASYRARASTVSTLDDIRRLASEIIERRNSLG